MSSIIVLDSSDEDSSEKQGLTQAKRIRLEKSSKVGLTSTVPSTMSPMKTQLKPTQPTSADIHIYATTIGNIVKPARTTATIRPVISHPPQKMMKTCPIPSGITITRFSPTGGVKVYPLSTTTAGQGTSTAENDPKKITTHAVQLKVNSTFRKTLDQQMTNTAKQKNRSSPLEQPKFVHQPTPATAPIHVLQKPQQPAEISSISQPAEPNKKTPQNRTNQIIPQNVPKNIALTQMKPALTSLAPTNPPVVFHRVGTAAVSPQMKPKQSKVGCLKIQPTSVKTPQPATLQPVPQVIPVSRGGITISPLQPMATTLPPNTSETTISGYSPIATTVDSSLTQDTLSSATATMTPVVPMLPIITSVQSMAPSATPPLKLLATPPHIASSLLESAEYLSQELKSPPRPSSATDSSKVQTPTETNAIPTKSPLLSPTLPSVQQVQQAPSITNVAISQKPKAASPVTPQRRRIQPTLLSPLLKSTDVANNNNDTNNVNSDVGLISTSPFFSNSRSPPVISEDSTSMDPQPSNFEGRCDNEVEIITTKLNAQEQADAPIDSPEYEELLRACREADSSEDMEKLVKMKLIKYYHNAHGDYLRSRSFRKSVLATIEVIKREPALVYLHLKPFVDELKVRRGNKASVADEEITEPKPTNNDATKELDANESIETSERVPSPPTTSTGNKQTDKQIKKLNRTLHILKKHIDLLEEDEVDWDDEDSSYLRLERLKKRACLIYNKICDLTGESRHAHRLDKKPIKFNGTDYAQFNKTLQAYINRTKAFPDFCDVLRLFEHCNETCGYNLAPFQAKRVAQDAFIEVGKLLQARRKTDLYETVTHFTANAKDPAQTDPDLLAKLSDNRKKHTRISEVLAKYAREQDMNADELRLARLQKASYAENGSVEKVIDNDNPAATLKDTERDETENKDIAKNLGE